MKRILPVVLALFVGLALGALLFRGSGGPGERSGTDAAGSAGGDTDSIWTCSMHPQVKAPKPGLCPICAMDLIPLGALGEGDGERTFSMSEAARELAGIETVGVVRENPEAEIRLFGKIVYDETTMRSVSARFPARIDRLFVDYTGIPVKAGDHLATVYSPDLLSAQEELLTAREFDNAGALAAARDKLRLWGFSDKRIGEIESSGKVSDRLTIDAPVGGIVTHKNVDEGDYVETGTPFFRIADLDKVWVLLKAYESDTPWLRFGQDLTFTTESLPGRSFEGKVSFIAPELDPETRTVSVRVNVNNEENTLKPGMFVSGIVHATVAGAGRVLDPSLAGKWISPMHPEIVKDGPGQCDICGMDLLPAEELGYVADGGGGDPPLLVPASAVLHTGRRSIVYVEVPDVEEPTYEGREILLGPRAGDRYLVAAGLRVGERVVSEGGFVIDSALQIQAKKSMMLPGEGEGERLFPEAGAPEEFLTRIDELLESYYGVHAALANDSFDDARAAAEQFAEELSALSAESLPPGSTEVWEDLSGHLAKSVDRLTSAEAIASFRKDFQPFTRRVDEMIRRFGTAHLPAWTHYCPMAFDDTGATWLQPDRELLNPYFGAEMLQCGEVREQVAGAKPYSLDESGTRLVSDVIDAYFDVQQSLADDSSEPAAEAAQELATRVRSLAPLADQHPEAAFLLGSISDALSDAAEKVGGSDSLALQRVHFQSLSRAAGSLVTVFGGELDRTVYRAHCPMAFNDTGADWLQPEEDLLNPYFGSEMLKCGEIEERLAGPPEEDVPEGRKEPGGGAGEDGEDETER